LEKDEDFISKNEDDRSLRELYLLNGIGLCSKFLEVPPIKFIEWNMNNLRN